MGGQPAIQVRGLAKAYGTLRAVDGLDLDVEPGQCVALLGPNGAGKTTTTEILEGYRHRDAGEVRVLGVDPARGDRHWRARIGIVLQQVGDLGELTVRESLRHFAGYYPDPRPVDEVLEQVGLAAKADARGRTLSGGQRRRLDVGLGIVGRPELLFLDEPTTGFDPEARREFWTLVETLKDEGATILLTTHYLEEAEALADRVGVITRGRLVAFDPPGELGGRHTGSARVRWTEDGQPRSEETEEPTALVAALAARFGGEVPNLTVTRPTLEDMYLALVDEPAEPA
ncbi:MAG: ABC transporter ATP-binding protein [Candidatus Nanopelagicales bacterium]|nr:ABC transporter ATP-binding protein [Candidatus Nanopelagicales bacterium]